MSRRVGGAGIATGHAPMGRHRRVDHGREVRDESRVRVGSGKRGPDTAGNAQDGITLRARYVHAAIGIGGRRHHRFGRRRVLCMMVVVCVRGRGGVRLHRHQGMRGGVAWCAAHDLAHGSPDGAHQEREHEYERAQPEHIGSIQPPTTQLPARTDRR